MKIKLLVIAILFAIILYGCATSVVYLEPGMQQRQPWRTDSLFIDNIGRDGTDNMMLLVRLSLGYKVAKIGLKDIVVLVVDKEGQKLTITMVSEFPGMYYEKEDLESYVAASSFKELPARYRYSSFGGEPANYTFYFRSTTKIRSKSIDLDVMILFEDGRTLHTIRHLEKRQDLYLPIH